MTNWQTVPLTPGEQQALDLLLGTVADVGVHLQARLRAFLTQRAVDQGLPDDAWSIEMPEDLSRVAIHGVITTPVETMAIEVVATSAAQLVQVMRSQLDRVVVPIVRAHGIGPVSYRVNWDPAAGHATLEIS